jgi:uncharacterized protein (TIGR04255 family)
MGKLPLTAFRQSAMLTSGGIIKNMALKMPEKLKLSPLRETFFEVQFEPTIPTAGDILPGLLYSHMKSEYPTVMPLPMANVPRKVRQQNPGFHYQASHRLQGAAGSILIGDSVISLTTLEYPGWNHFKSKLISLLKVLKATEQAKTVKRFSFKYINLIEAQPKEPQLAFLNMKIECVGTAPRERGFHLRTEFEQDNYTTIVQVAPGSTVKVPSSNSEISGLLVDVDTIRFEPGPDFLSNPDSLLEEAHLVAKKIFFSLLTPSTVERLQPIL